MSQSSTPKKYRMISPFQGVISTGGVYNTREILQESGEWEAPITGTIKVTCIGGGGAGSSGLLSGGYQHSVRGHSGGDTSFGDALVAKGGPSIGAKDIDGGAFGGGGYAGEVETIFVDVQQGDTIDYIVGAGGAASGSFVEDGPVTLDGYNEYSYPGTAISLLRYSSAQAYEYAGGTGGHNGTPYGGGGGGASYGRGLSQISGNAFGGGNGFRGAQSFLSTNGQFVLGGDGGNGAIILEYADPKKKS